MNGFLPLIIEKREKDPTIVSLTVPVRAGRHLGA